ncbi:MAG: hypothetical protein KatS3mg105_0409 [Gemmatales bacterium]|nr:MAG: hypothetical protein KatS3mg105_0409 [Gemmatales bacterium]
MTGFAYRWQFVFAAGLLFALVPACNKKPTVDAPKSPAKQGNGGENTNGGTAKSGDWPMFGGSPDRNMVNLTAKNVPIDFKVRTEGEEEGVKWTVKLGSRAYGGPIVAGGKIFVGTNNENPRNPRDTVKGEPIDKGVVMCFNEADGKFLWQAVHDKLPAGRVWDWPKEGICSSPFVEGDRLYYVSNRCEVICADTEGFYDGENDGVQDEQYKDKTDADIVWRLNMIEQLGVFPHNLATSSPLIVGDRLFVVTSNGVDEAHKNIPVPQAPSFIAVDKKTGKVLWQKSYPGTNIMHGQWSSPAYAEVNGRGQVIFPGGDGWLYSLKPENGEIIWKFDANPKDAVYVLGGAGTRNDFIATPVVYKNKCYIGVGQDPEHDEGVGHLWCIDITKTGDISKDLLISGKPGDPNDPVKTMPNPNSGVIWHFGGVAPEDSDRRFTFGRTLSTCAVHDDLVYAGDMSGYVYCLDANTGKLYWVHEMGAVTWSSPYWVDGKIFFGNDDGILFVFQHGREKKILAEIEFPRGTRLRATPVVANNTLYVMTENRLYAIGK